MAKFMGRGRYGFLDVPYPLPPASSNHWSTFSRGISYTWIREYVACRDWFPSFRIMFAVLIHVWYALGLPFYDQVVRLMGTLYLDFSCMGWWICDLFLLFKKSVAINIHVQFFVWMYVFVSFGCIPRRGIARWCNNFIFNIFLGTAKLFSQVVAPF